MTAAEIEKIASAFVTARRRAEKLEAFPGALPATLADAYRVQERALALDGRPVAGWKVAGIRPDLRPVLGADRLAGPIFADNVRRLPDGGRAEAAVYQGGFAALEAEFVAVFARDLKPGPAGVTAAAVLDALEGLHAGSEVASSPLASLNDIGPLAVVCDHGNNAGAIVGPLIADWRNLPAEQLASRMLIDGQVAGEGTAASVAGGPVAALVFLAENLRRRGRYLGKGDVVLTGMTTGIHPVKPGSLGRIEFAGAAACDIDVVAARAR